jgi:hypothetical protein
MKSARSGLYDRIRPANTLLDLGSSNQSLRKATEPCRKHAAPVPQTQNAAVRIRIFVIMAEHRAMILRIGSQRSMTTCSWQHYVDKAKKISADPLGPNPTNTGLPSKFRDDTEEMNSMMSQTFVRERFERRKIDASEKNIRLRCAREGTHGTMNVRLRSDT